VSRCTRSIVTIRQRAICLCPWICARLWLVRRGHPDYYTLMLSGARRNLICQSDEAGLAPLLALQRTVHLLVQISLATQQMRRRPVVMDLSALTHKLR
jgi:hypothetical protein